MYAVNATMDEPDPIEDIHAELDSRQVRACKIALGVLLLMLLGLWCASQAAFK